MYVLTLHWGGDSQTWSEVHSFKFKTEREAKLAGLAMSAAQQELMTFVAEEYDEAEFDD